MNSVQALCDRAIWLDKGRIRADSKDVRHVTIEYLVGGEGDNRAEWVNESTALNKEALVVLRAMRLIDSSGKVVNAPVPNNMELTLELEIDLREFDPGLTLGYAIYTEEGQVLWYSYQSDEKTNSLAYAAQGDQSPTMQPPD